MSDDKNVIDMYLIAALLAYGFEQVKVNTEDVERQRYVFRNSPKTVFYLNGIEVEKKTCNIDDVELLYSGMRLLFPPSYPGILKSVKYSILSKKNDKR